MNHPFSTRDDLKYYGKIAAHGMGIVAGQVEITTDCFQQCRMCDSWRPKHTQVEMTRLQLNQICSQLNNTDTFENLSITGGDPQNVSWFEDWLLEDRTNWEFELQVNTALTQPISLGLLNADEVRVSLDSLEQATYTKIRGDSKTDPEDVIDRILELVESVPVHILMCTMESNVSEIPKFVSLFKNTKVRKVTFLPMISEKNVRESNAGPSSRIHVVR
jgi:MoaA/NifB/PqqE/SkfB family radical SAM enzyme